MIRVAVDAMGGDHAPAAEVAGVLAALAEYGSAGSPAFTAQLVGRRDVIEAELARHPGADRSHIELHDAPDVIGMGEKPLAAVRKKPLSSIVVGLKLQAAGRSDAFLSAGNTGAVLAASTLILGLHEGVERATAASAFPTESRPVIVLDAGANVDCSARELVNFARLGTVYVRDIFDRPNPTVGLLNVGEEEEKGNATAREAHQLLKRTPGLNYIGNIEGRDILPGHPVHGPVDVIVCDGFVGNIVLKFYESAAKLLVGIMRREAPEVLTREDFGRVLTFLDYTEYGGAPLLGVKGIAVMCHGASNANAIKNAIRVTVHSVERRLDEHIGAQFARQDAAAARA
ncbi:MAG TPA: phosphate acyltransferase PlsX [Gemmatimonadales bacterium]|nr:phosphate acyltransferase PlsX [Gemmatimonadales bacterium]